MRSAYSPLIGTTIAAQTRLPDDGGVCDGGSRDNTVAVIQTYADRFR